MVKREATKDYQRGEALRMQGEDVDGTLTFLEIDLLC